MNNALKVFCVSLLTLLYCSAVGLFSASKTPTGFQGTNTSESNNHFSDASQVLFAHTSQSETIVSNFSASPNPCVKDISGGFWAIRGSAIRLAEMASACYVRKAFNTDLRTRLSELLFPFHFFW